MVSTKVRLAPHSTQLSALPTMIDDVFKKGHICKTTKSVFLFHLSHGQKANLPQSGTGSSRVQKAPMFLKQRLLLLAFLY